MTKVLMKGNEAMAEAALRAGCDCFFGYPITPQNEIPEYLSREMPKRGKVFVQSESEVAAINMVYGAAGAGARAMTSSSSPGIALKQEGISYIAGANLPCVIINVSRGGPGLGGIQPSQADYYQATRGGGNGDYNVIVFGPSDLQEACDIIGNSFNLAEKYRVPVQILVDGVIGQMMEPVEFGKEDHNDLSSKPWATTGTEEKRTTNIINSLSLSPDGLEDLNIILQKKYEEIKNNEQKWEELMIDDAEIVLVSYGTSSRIAKSAIAKLREEGYKVGLIRPITLWPFPVKAFSNADKYKAFLSVEMSAGQMVDDVRLAVNGRAPVEFFGRMGGNIPSPEEIIKKVKEMHGGQ